MPWSIAAFELLVQVSLGGCVLLGLAYLAVLLLREPARKARVIELVLLGLLALPLFAMLPGYPRVAVLPTWESKPRVIDTKCPAAKPVAEPASALFGQLAALPGEDAPNDAEPAPAIDQTSPPAIAADVPNDTTVGAETPISRAPAASEATETGWQRDFRPWVVGAYLGGVIVMCGWSLLGLVAVRRLTRAAQPADESLRMLLSELAGPSGDRVRLLVSPRAAQPCAFGWRRPTIVLPTELVATGDPQQLRFALAHEWSHIARGDVGAWMLAGLVRGLHFYQPLVWLLRRELRLAQDYLADAAAAGSGTPEDYAEFLTAVSQAFKPPRLATGLGIAARRSDLHRRVVMLVENDRSLERVTPKRWNLVALLLAISMVAAAASLRAEPQEAPKSTTPDAAATAQAPSEPAVPVELDPARIRENMRTYGAIEQAVARDPLIRELSHRLEELLHLEDLGTTELNTRLKRQIMEVLKQLDERRESVRAAALKSASADRNNTAPTTTPTSTKPAPFSGRIRPGDMLNIEIIGGFPTGPLPPRTVEPDGNVALTPVYGGKRLQVAGKTLTEAGEIITAHLKTLLKNPQALVTYAGHDNGVVAEGAVEQTAIVWASGVVLAPLDTIELVLPLKPHVHKFLHDGALIDAYTGDMPVLSGVYVIEPDGNICLPQGLGRVKIAGLNERQAGDAVRTHLAQLSFTRTALPTARVFRRGRAVFPAGKEPSADYRVRPFDKLLVSMGGSPQMASEMQVGEEGELTRGVPLSPVIQARGLTLDEVERELREKWRQSFFRGRPGPENAQSPPRIPWYVTIGGWREEADPAVIDRIENGDATRVEQLEQELREIKTMIRGLKR